MPLEPSGKNRASRGYEGDDVKGASIVAELQPRAENRAARLAPWAIGCAVGLLALQALAAGRLELTFDEAYYFLWSRSVAFGYLDHPPMIALLIRASTDLFGDSELGVRALSLILVGALPALIALIAWRLFRSSETAALAVLMWIAMPLVLAGAVFVTPDAPLVLFWTLGLAALAELLRTGKARWLIALGVALGLALESKFTAAFFGAGVGLAFLATPSLRRWLFSPASAAALAIALALFAPFVVWNAEHGWATFLKQLGRAPPHGFAPFYLVEFAAAQIGLMNPLVFAALVSAGAAVSWRGRPVPGSPDEARRMLISTILPAFAYFLIHALHDRVQGELAGAAFSRLRDPRRRLGRRDAPQKCRRTLPPRLRAARFGPRPPASPSWRSPSPRRRWALFPSAGPIQPPGSRASASSRRTSMRGRGPGRRRSS